MPNRRAALAVAGALLLAALGQLLLERAPAAGGRDAVLGALALAASAVLAVTALRKGGYLPEPPRPFELPRFRPALYAACLPGAVTLVLALAAHLASPDGSRSAILWGLGLVLLVLPGVVDWFRNPRPPSPHETRERRRYLAAAAALFAFAFAIRIWGGINRIPGWLDSDEAGTGLAGRAVLAEGPRALFGFWEMGNPNMTLFVSQVAAWPFGEGLRALRLGSALLGSLTVVFLFDFARRLVGGRAALVAALLLAVNHTFVHLSRVGQIYIDTPFFASVVLALLLRVMTGGSFLALTGAGIALGIGAVTYTSTGILPAVVAATLAGWAIIQLWPRKRVLPVALFLAAIVVLVCAPIAVTVLRMRAEIAYQRVPAISLLRPDGVRQLEHAYRAGSAGEAMGVHLLRTIGIFNFGWDHFKAYGANRPMNDAVTAALIPAAFAVLLYRLSTPVGWLGVVFTGAYLAGGVLLCSTPPTFHRVSVVLLFSSIAVAWTALGLARVLAAEAGAPRWLLAAGLTAFVAVSAWLNLHYYFRELKRTRLTEAAFGLGRLVCRYAPGHAVVVATTLDGRDYVPVNRHYEELECPEARPIRVDSAARVWDFPDMTDARRVVVILPTEVEAANPGEPRGYRLVRRTVDRTIELPAPLALSVREYERAP